MSPFHSPLRSLRGSFSRLVGRPLGALELRALTRVKPARSRAGVAGGPRAWLATLTLALPIGLGACDARRPVEPPPVMPQAVPARVPGDISSERLALVVDEVGEALVPRFGALAPVAYRLPTDVAWGDVERFYAQALAGRMAPVPNVYREGRRHRLAVWSADGRSGGPMLAVAFVDTPVSGEPATHGVLVLLTPAPR